MLQRQEYHQLNREYQSVRPLYWSTVKNGVRQSQDLSCLQSASSFVEAMEASASTSTFPAKTSSTHF